MPDPPDKAGQWEQRVPKDNSKGATTIYWRSNSAEQKEILSNYS